MTASDRHNNRPLQALGRALWLGSLLMAGLLGLSAPALADVTVRSVEIMQDYDEVPRGSTCWILHSDDERGLPNGFEPELPTAELFCADCLSDPAYEVKVPVSRIQQRILDPNNLGADYTCDESCVRWLIRPPAQPESALLFVRVLAGTVCGATGWCPGLIYERRQGAWHLAYNLSTNESNTLCLWPQQGDRIKMWLTPLEDPDETETLEIFWRPQ